MIDNHPPIRVDIWAKKSNGKFNLWGGRFWFAVPRIGDSIEVDYYQNRHDEFETVICKVVNVIWLNMRTNYQQVSVYFEWPVDYKDPEI